MSKYDNIIIIGATGLVGQEFIKLIKLEYNNLKKLNIQLTSNNSVGLLCDILNIEYQSLESINFLPKTIFINCANSEQAKYVVERMEDNSILIDNSSEYRMNKSVPLIIPEVNWFDFNKDKHKVIANPNCSTIILSMLLNAFIKNNFIIERIVVSTYQAASGAGREGLNELEKQTREIVNDESLTIQYWGDQYIYNTFVHNSPIEENGYCQEENKLINETNKIFKTEIKISPTCIRVPVLRSHCESVNIEFKNRITDKTIYKTILNEKETLELINDTKEHKFPTSLSSNGQTKVQVGHIRKDMSLPEDIGWNFWISGDQLLRGASYNAFLIMKKLLC